MIGTLVEHWKEGFREVFESAVAAGIAFWIGSQLFGAQHVPLFAPLAAIICLSPGLPSHSKQALGMLFGVFAGIGIGELVLATPTAGHPVWLAIAVFVAMMLAIAMKVQPVIGIQAGISAAIVMVEGAQEESYTRLVDAMIGGGVALLFSQVLLTPDPFKIIGRGARKLIEEACELREEFDGCRTADKDKAELRRLLAELRDAERRFVEELDYADQIAGRTLRGWLRRDEIRAATRDWRTRARELHLALGTMGYTLEHGDGEQRDALCEEHLGEADALIGEARAVLA